MATRKPDDPRHDTLPGEQEIAQLYREGGLEAPPTALDAAILAEARRSIQQTTSPKSTHLRWVLPLSTAAVVVLAVGAVLLMSRQGALNHHAGLDIPSEYDAAPASSPPLAEAREQQPADIAKAKRAVTEPVEPAMSLTSPPVAGRLADAERKSMAREEAARAPASGVVAMKTQGANVIAVQESGSPGAYTFNVTVRSPDTGCQQYADWWEVLSEDGKLLYRRVLFHSHVGEQPFTRDGGPVPIHADTVVWVRAHMNTAGYGGAALKGSVKTGFKPAALDAAFAAGVARQQPLPDGCAF